MEVQAIIAGNLRKMRIRKGLSQENLAVDAQIDRTYVSRLERALENPTVAVLERLAKALDAEMIEFFTLPVAGEKPPKPLPSGRRKRC